MTDTGGGADKYQAINWAIGCLFFGLGTGIWFLGWMGMYFWAVGQAHDSAPDSTSPVAGILAVVWLLLPVVVILAIGVVAFRRRRARRSAAAA